MHQGRSFSSSCSVRGKRLCAAAALLVGTSSLGAKQAEPTPAQVALHVLQQDIRVAELLRSLQESAPHGLLVVRNVQTVDAAAETVTPGQSVMVKNDVISWVGDAAKEPRFRGRWSSMEAAATWRRVWSTCMSTPARPEDGCWTSPTALPQCETWVAFHGFCASARA